jgi:hypothetical protein
MTFYGIDYETSYTKERSIKTLGVKGYLRHPETDLYAVSIVGSDGFNWVGNPRNAPWDEIKHGLWLSHNSEFDSSCSAELRHRGVHAPEPEGGWHCTANLAAFLQSPRDLKGASRELLGIEIDKGVRDDMEGKTWKDLSPERQKEVQQYALGDSAHCLELWLKYGSQWPENERGYSDHTAFMCKRGIGIDLGGVAKGIARMEECLDLARKRIPWAGQLNAKGKEVKLTSPKEIKNECERRGIPAPTTTDAKSELWQEWLDTYEEQADFIKGIQAHRRANRTLKVLQQMQARTVDGTLYYSLLYGGAPHTMRWSGTTAKDDSRDGGGLNMHNLPKDPYEGVDIRSLLVPGDPDYVFLAFDYAQIEARVTLWLGGDELLLNMVRGGMDLYEADARRNFGYANTRPLREVDKKLRQFVKGQYLGLGFQMGAGRYQRVANSLGGLDLSLTQAKTAVDGFRRNNRGVVNCWKKLERGLAGSKGSRLFQTELPSGSKINYFDIACIDGEFSGRHVRGGERKKLFPGKLFENMVQRIAREILAEAVVSLEDAGLPVHLHVHDEAVARVPRKDAKDAMREMDRIMRIVPPWAEGLPIDVEGKELERYGK